MKITCEQYIDWLCHYYESVHGTGVRAGQDFCNTFLTNGETCPELFYQEDHRKAIDYIGEHLIEIYDFVKEDESSPPCQMQSEPEELTDVSCDHIPKQAHLVAFEGSNTTNLSHIQEYYKER